MTINKLFLSLICVFGSFGMTTGQTTIGIGSTYFWPFASTNRQGDVVYSNNGTIAKRQTISNYSHLNGMASGITLGYMWKNNIGINIQFYSFNGKTIKIKTQYPTNSTYDKRKMTNLFVVPSLIIRHSILEKTDLIAGMGLYIGFKNNLEWTYRSNETVAYSDGKILAPIFNLGISRDFFSNCIFQFSCNVIPASYLPKYHQVLSKTFNGEIIYSPDNPSPKTPLKKVITDFPNEFPVFSFPFSGIGLSALFSYNFGEKK